MLINHFRKILKEIRRSAPKNERNFKTKVSCFKNNNNIQKTTKLKVINFSKSPFQQLIIGQ